jgi:hypothetical protein
MSCGLVSVVGVCISNSSIYIGGGWERREKGRRSGLSGPTRGLSVVVCDLRSDSGTWKRVNG